MGNLFKDSEAVNKQVAEAIKEHSKTDNAILFEMVFKYMRYYLSLIAFGVLSKSLLWHSFSSGIYSLKIFLVIPALTSIALTAIFFIIWMFSLVELTGYLLLNAPKMGEFNEKYFFSFFNSFWFNFILIPIITALTFGVILSLKLPLF